MFSGDVTLASLPWGVIQSPRKSHCESVHACNSPSAPRFPAQNCSSLVIDGYMFARMPVSPYVRYLRQRTQINTCFISHDRGGCCARLPGIRDNKPAPCRTPSSADCGRGVGNMSCANMRQMCCAGAHTVLTTVGLLNISKVTRPLVEERASLRRNTVKRIAST